MINFTEFNFSLRNPSAEDQKHWRTAALLSCDFWEWVTLYFHIQNVFDFLTPQLTTRESRWLPAESITPSLLAAHLVQEVFRNYFYLKLNLFCYSLLKMEVNHFWCSFRQAGFLATLGNWHRFSSSFILQCHQSISGQIKVRWYKTTQPAFLIFQMMCR